MSYEERIEFTRWTYSMLSGMVYFSQSCIQFRIRLLERAAALEEWDEV